MMRNFLLVILIFISVNVFAQDTIQLMSYNILGYYDTPADSATRNKYFRTTLKATKPDILAVTEIKYLNGSLGFYNEVVRKVDTSYGRAPYINGYDTNSSLYFNKNKFHCDVNEVIQTTLRDINHYYLIRNESNDTLHLFVVHLKASNGTVEAAQRKSEVDSLRKVTDLLPLNSSYIVCGDFNFYGSTEAGYQRLLEVNGNNTGHFKDKINITGTWNNSSYAQYHTQSPRTRSFGGGVTGGMDDRFDMILFSPSVYEDGDIKFIQNSYKAYGNDGQHYNDSINQLPNYAVPDSVANSLHYAADHIPVIVKLAYKNAFITSTRSNVSKDLKVNIYPNPSNSIFNIYSNEISRFSTVKIFSTQGVLLKEIQVHNDSYSIQFDLSEFLSGIYFYQLKGNDISKSGYLIKQ